MVYASANTISIPWMVALPPAPERAPVSFTSCTRPPRERRPRRAVRSAHESGVSGRERDERRPVGRVVGASETHTVDAGPGRLLRERREGHREERDRRHDEVEVNRPVAEHVLCGAEERGFLPVVADRRVDEIGARTPAPRRNTRST